MVAVKQYCHFLIWWALPTLNLSMRIKTAALLGVANENTQFCGVYGPCLRSQQKGVSFLPFDIYYSLWCLELKIYPLLCGWRHQQRTTEPITLSLAHVHRVTSNQLTLRLCCWAQNWPVGVIVALVDWQLHVKTRLTKPLIFTIFMTISSTMALIQ